MIKVLYYNGCNVNVTCLHQRNWEKKEKSFATHIHIPFLESALLHLNFLFQHDWKKEMRDLVGKGDNSKKQEHYSLSDEVPQITCI